MKGRILIAILALLPVFSFSSCSKDSLDPESVIKTTSYDNNEFDDWLDVNFVAPYNIRFKYRYEMNESDYNYFTVPAQYEYSIIMAHLVKYLCIESYDEVAGITFTRKYFPKMFFLIGDFEYRNNGTIILGTAEGGKKILLAGVNYVNYCLARPDLLNIYYIKMIHHEFTHILNQTVDFSTDFGQITGSGYVADSWSVEPYVSNYLANGFITDYAQHSDTEDFAEMMSSYITHDEAWWQEQLAAAGNPGAGYISSKLDIVKSYMMENFNIDLDELREVISRRQDDVFSGKLDLLDLNIQ